jgi:hypothetical protein
MTEPEPIIITPAGVPLDEVAQRFDKQPQPEPVNINISAIDDASDAIGRVADRIEQRAAHRRRLRSDKSRRRASKASRKRNRHGG